ncbi:MAG: hypothetical protein Q9210_003277, partial [Variospora velana]
RAPPLLRLRSFIRACDIRHLARVQDPEINFVDEIIHDVLGDLLHIPLSHPSQPAVLALNVLFPGRRVLGCYRARTLVCLFDSVIILVFILCCGVAAAVAYWNGKVTRRTPEIRPEVHFHRPAAEDADGGEITQHAVVQAIARALLRSWFRSWGEESEEGDGRVVGVRRGGGRGVRRRRGRRGGRRGRVHEFLEVFGAAVFELLEVDDSFVPDGHAVADDVRSLGCGVRVQVVRDVDGFVVRSFDDFPVQSERGERDLETDNVTFVEGFVAGGEILRARHVYFLAGYVAEAVAVGIEPDGGVEVGFAASPAKANVATAGGVWFVEGWRSRRRPDAAENLAFIVPAAFTGGDIGAGHAEPFLGCDTPACGVKEDVGGGFLKGQASVKRGGFGLTKPSGRRKRGVGDALALHCAYMASRPMAMPTNLPASSKATLDLHIETPPSRSHVLPARSGGATDEEPYEELELTFNKTLDGHYRHGKTGYKRVGVLFLTWEEDDLQCKETEVDALRAFFADEFKFETDYFQIPKDRWQTALHRRIADLLYEYDSPDCLTIIYYGGHGYVGEETRSLKLSAKIAADESGDPTLFMNDILGCCRLPACDQLLILDCCYAANAFGPEHLGKRKFEMIVSSGCANKVPAPHQPGSFTKSLNQVLSKLLRENKAGFATSQLYREIYHSIPHHVKPWLFDQAKRDYGRIWLRPQAPLTPGDVGSKEGGAYLNLTLKLNKEPDSVVMNQLALSLQYLPHVDQVRVEKLYAPRKQIENFMLFVQRAAKLRPFIRKIHAKRRLKQLKSLPQSELVLQRPLSLIKLYMDQKHSSAFDWSSALDGHNPSPSSPVIHRRKKSFTSPVEAESDTKRQRRV